MSGWSRRTQSATVPLPTAVGPARTTRRERCSGLGFWGDGGVGPSGTRLASPAAAELLQECLDLVGAQTTQPTAVGDADAIHDLLRADLADTRHGLQEVADPQLGDDLVGPGLLENLGERGSGVLEAVLHLGSQPTSLCSLLERCLTLLRRQDGECHNFTSLLVGSTRSRKGDLALLLDILHDGPALRGRLVERLIRVVEGLELL